MQLLDSTTSRSYFEFLQRRLDENERIMLASITSKLGKSKGVEQSRIWIEGPRCTASGFSVGAPFSESWEDNKLTFTLDPHGNRNVSGKGTPRIHPVLDTTGRKVRETFSHTHVEVKFFQGAITFEGVTI
tara:strand:- start:210 stop:599 length:390 start_codon:yes stop_codon:yes gene_type:complete